MNYEGLFSEQIAGLRAARTQIGQLRPRAYQNVWFWIREETPRGLHRRGA